MAVADGDKRTWILGSRFPYFRNMINNLFINKVISKKYKWITTFFFFFRNSRSFIYLFMTVLSLRFCGRAFSSCGKWGPLFIAVRGPLTIAASLAAEHSLQTCRLSNCGSRAPLLRGMWDLPRPGLEPLSPALAGRFSTTAPPGKPITTVLIFVIAHCAIAIGQAICLTEIIRHL